MKASTPPSLPPRQGGLEHKPVKVGGGLQVPTLIKVPPPPPPKSNGGTK